MIRRKALWGALIGALLGGALMLPIGSTLVDGGPDCTACGYWVNVLGGFRFENQVPAWAPIASVTVGALLGALVVWAWLTARARA